jgi:Uma2 family endonuclease
MVHPAEEKKYYTVEEYFQHEEESEFRSEFYNNELFPIETTTRRHNDIVNNVLTTMRSIFRPRGCNVYTENIKVEAIKNGYYPYPDVVLNCDPEDNHHLFVKNPILIVEVASPGTATYDKTFKWKQYRKISSLRYYLMISQDEISVELFSRGDNQSLWTFQDFTDIQDVITLNLLDFELKLSDVYELIEF